MMFTIFSPFLEISKPSQARNESCLLNNLLFFIPARPFGIVVSNLKLGKTNNSDLLFLFQTHTRKLFKTQ